MEERRQTGPHQTQKVYRWDRSNPLKVTLSAPTPPTFLSPQNKQRKRRRHTTHHTTNSPGPQQTVPYLRIKLHSSNKPRVHAFHSDPPGYMFSPRTQHTAENLLHVEKQPTNDFRPCAAEPLSHEIPQARDWFFVKKHACWSSRKSSRKPGQRHHEKTAPPSSPLPPTVVKKTPPLIDHSRTKTPNHPHSFQKHYIPTVVT